MEQKNENSVNTTKKISTIVDAGWFASAKKRQYD